MKIASIVLLGGILGFAFTYAFPATQAQASETVLHSFSGTDGAWPYGGLIDVNGRLYGTTSIGGSHGCGTVFKFDPKTNAEQVLYSFCKKPGDPDQPYSSLIDVKGDLYGTTWDGNRGQAFAVGRHNGREKIFAVGGQPGFASLLNVNGILYGTGRNGGQADGGVVFSLNPGTRAVAYLYSFCAQKNCTDGTTPYAGLVNVKNVLYGTTVWGGSYKACNANGSGCGTVFALDLKTEKETVLHSFCSQHNCTDGAEPASDLIYSKGILYGTTEDGGATGAGTVFALDLSTGTETVLHSFGSSQGDGNLPVSGLLEVKGKLYGTTSSGGVRGCGDDGEFGCGTAFAVDIKTGTEEVLYSFCSQQDCSDGATPWGGLFDVNGTLYGTTVLGGTHGDGTVFSISR